MTREITPEWHSERFSKHIQSDIELNGQAIVEWFIKKNVMIATLNFLRARGYKCEWIEKSEDCFIIKITLNP